MGGTTSTNAQQIFLKYYKQQNRQFLDENLIDDALFTDFMAEIESLPPPDTDKTWKALLEEWKANIRDRFKNSIEQDEMLFFSSEDFQLINIDCLEIEECLMPIMKFFEEGIFGIESVKELIDKFQKPDESLQDWEIELMDYLKRLIHKKKLYDFNRNHLVVLNEGDEMRNYFTELELKFLVILSDPTNPNFTQIKMSFQICRLCSGHKSNMLNIFSCDSDGMSHSAKISQCVRIPPIETTDDLPKFICVDCANLLHTYHKFVQMCLDSDVQLRKETILRGVVIEKVLEKALEPNHLNISEDTATSFDIDSIDLDRFTDNTSSFSTTTPLESPQQTNLFEMEEDQKQEKNEIGKERQSDEVSTVEICDIKKHRCEICGAGFYDNYNYRVHLRIHKLARKFECSDCGKKFKTKVILRIHKRTHTGERPFSCDICGKMFKTTSAVASHQAVHLTVKAFKCDLCPYEGSTKPNLRIHQRTHSKEQPYSCQYCSKRFSTASNLLKHSRNIHQQQKTNQCQLCEKKFFSRESAKKHLITHTQSKPFACPHCPMSYSWYSGLEKHFQKNHKNKKLPAESSFKDRVEEALVSIMSGN